MEAQHAIIKRLEIKGLWGKQDFTFDFHDDLNIFTGSNGSGKTTILKVLWYAVSGNLHHLLQELPEFHSIHIDLFYTHDYTIDITPIVAKEKEFIQRENPIEYFAPGTLIANIVVEKILKKLKLSTGKFLISESEKFITLNTFERLGSSVNPYNFEFYSIFFPTFKRIESSFMKKNNYYHNIPEAMNENSSNFSNLHHSYISYSGINDIRNKINEISSNIRAQLSPIENYFSDFIAKNSKSLDPQLFTTQLNERLAEKQRQEAIITRPLTTFSRLIDELMLEKSVQVTDSLILSAHPNKVRLEDLSGGEKNLLGFMVYAMTQPAMMFIDEPELGMHLDWQRKFIAVMQEISPTTQYFIVTHSPAIRSAYPDHKFFLDDQLPD